MIIHDVPCLWFWNLSLGLLSCRGFLVLNYLVNCVIDLVNFGSAFGETEQKETGVFFQICLIGWIYKATFTELH